MLPSIFHSSRQAQKLSAGLNHVLGTSQARTIRTTWGGRGEKTAV